ncbi:MAG: hypothetical protein D6B25_07400 [Desulfobulbaceae bacterium]|nr:MAG: hypothetical protein D6B25_07400 [Desulfobulbaceae bacterium]
MARILYGVHGIGHGHGMRALTIARAFKDHQFLFLSDGDGQKLLEHDYQVEQIPTSGSPAYNHAMPYSRAVSSFFKNRSDKSARVHLKKIIGQFSPDLCICDYHDASLAIGKTLGIPCITLDHQHVALAKHPNLPWLRKMELALMKIACSIQFRAADQHAVISFFRPDSVAKKLKLFQPLLRSEVVEQSVSRRGHVLAYHGYSTTRHFYAFLARLPYPVICYGADREEKNGNLWFKRKRTHEFLNDLASAEFVISSAGHSLLSESLYLNKPIMAFPIRNAAEQYLNGFYLEKLGYGLMNDAFAPSWSRFERFQKNLDQYRETIAKNQFNGNQEIFRYLDQLFSASARNGGMPSP